MTLLIKKILLQLYSILLFNNKIKLVVSETIYYLRLCVHKTVICIGVLLLRIWMVKNLVCIIMTDLVLHAVLHAQKNSHFSTVEFLLKRLSGIKSMGTECSLKIVTCILYVIYTVNYTCVRTYITWSNKNNTWKIKKSSNHMYHVRISAKTDVCSIKRLVCVCGFERYR